MDIENLELSMFVYNRLKRRGINTVEHLKTLSDEDLKHIFALGSEGLAEVKEKIKNKYTNADRIRAMTDEELTYFLEALTNECCELGKAALKRSCEVEIVDIDVWLKQPAKEET